MYEEKSAAQIAEQVGLSENATRQLIFRARAAFKTALLGSDIDTTGMSVSAILSVAARKATAEAKKVGAQAMVLVLFMMLAVGAVMNFTGNRGAQTNTVAEGSSPSSAAPSASESASLTPDAGAAETAAPRPAETGDATAVVYSTPSAIPSNVAWEATSASTANPTPSQSPFTASQLKTLYSADPTVAGAIKAAAVSTSSSVQAFDVYDSVGSHSRIEINSAAANKVTSAVFDFTIQNQKYFVYLNDQKISETTLADGTHAFTVTGVAKLPFDAQGKVWDLSAFAGSAVELTFVMDAGYGQIQKAVFAVTAPKK
jgi:RNA polymerase sigma-70 factor (ECF subfamily)